MSCCIGENTECYTIAGCFCDESCYTKYGDCCTDHFLTCYENLKLCLIKIAEESNAQSAANIHVVTKEQAGHYETVQMSEEDAEEIGFQQRSASFYTETSNPEHLTPNACCLQVPYNDNEENGQGDKKTCCKGVLTFDSCHEEQNEE